MFEEVIGCWRDILPAERVEPGATIVFLLFDTWELWSRDRDLEPTALASGLRATCVYAVSGLGPTSRLIWEFLRRFFVSVDLCILGLPVVACVVPRATGRLAIRSAVMGPVAAD